jgi:hypothetical protein
LSMTRGMVSEDSMSNASKGATALAGAVAAFVAFAPSSTQVDRSTDPDVSSGAISSAATKAIQKKMENPALRMAKSKFLRVRTEGPSFIQWKGQAPPKPK